MDRCILLQMEGGNHNKVPRQRRGTLCIIAMIMLLAYSGNGQVAQKVQDYIQTHLPGWHIVDTADYAKTWWSFYDRKQVPFFVTIDLNDDQQEDYALLLKKSDILQLAVLTGSGKSFTHWMAEDFFIIYKGGVRDVQYGLAIEPPARIDVLEPKEASLILRSNGLTIMEMEQRSRIYYWEGGTIKTFYAK
jgi:hypothetical protein